MANLKKVSSVYSEATKNTPELYPIVAFDTQWKKVE
jgi:hypothetical protein